MHSQTDKAHAFRKLHTEPGTFVLPNPWDVGSAKVLAGLGFKALATTSSGMAWSMGLLDGQVTRDDVLAHCRLLADATDLPLAADLEDCFADSPEGAAETIRLGAEQGWWAARLKIGARRAAMLAKRGCGPWKNPLSA